MRRMEKILESASTMSCDDDDECGCAMCVAEREGRAIPNGLRVKPITIILGRKWPQMNSLAEFLGERMVGIGYTWVVTCPESRYHHVELCGEFAELVINNHNPNGTIVISTNSMAFVDTIKRAIGLKKLNGDSVSFVYVSEENSLKTLQVTDKGHWVEPYPDRSYAYAGLDPFDEEDDDDPEPDDDICDDDSDAWDEDDDEHWDDDDDDGEEVDTEAIAEQAKRRARPVTDINGDPLPQVDESEKPHIVDQAIQEGSNILNNRRTADGNG